MNTFTLSTFLTSHIEIEADFVKTLIARCKSLKVDKGGYLLKPGEVCQHSFYVEQGLLRYYSIDEKGKEHILQFASEGWFVSDRESVYFHQPSHYFIQALEDSRVILLDENFITRLAQENKSFLEFNNKLLHNHIRHLQNRINQLLSASAEDRYLHFVKIYPDLLLRIPQSMVASYLGITPESLSRVRKDLATKNFKR
ncbi:MAG: Crp/Fnr family transcriptional regulator [Bacteroidetes bacterium]|nr:Crp/Fnr family transcriptional regulator [Bacteroidota bacterium]